MKRAGQSRRAFINKTLKGVASMVLLSGNDTQSMPESDKKTGYIFDADYMNHILDPNHPESPQRLVTIQKLLSESGLIEQMAELDLLADPMPFINMVHSEWHINRISKIPVTGPIARKAAAGATGAVKAVFEGTVDRAFCAIRPPGHHAHNAGTEEGFCFYNNIAIAARYAQQECDCSKILIVDWDYHHGNGTEDAFYTDNTVFFFSTHRWPAYPLSGAPNRTGDGKGKGYNFNWPLPSPDAPRGEVTDEHILDAFDKQLIAALEKKDFQPDMVLISAGFDSRIGDALGDFDISYDCFAKLTEIVCGIADRWCDGKVVSILEGGYINPVYDPMGLAKAVAQHVEALIYHGRKK